MLLQRFKLLWGHKWTDSISDISLEIVIEEWTEGLKSYDDATIKEALVYSRDYLRWPPTIADFRAICDRIIGIPDIDEAFQYAVRQEFVHPAIEMAYNTIGSWDFRHLDEKTLRARFSRCYLKGLQQVKSHKELTHESTNRIESSPRDQSRRTGMRHAQEYLLSTKSME